MGEEISDGLRVNVLVLPKKGVLDPEGQAVERVLISPLGFKVSNVRIGRVYELVFPPSTDTTEALCLVGEMCTKTAVLVNPLVESYEIKVLREDDENSTSTKKRP